MTTDNIIVRNRAVFFVGGFDPKSPTAFYHRMDRENGRFERLWGAQVSRQTAENPHEDIVGARFFACDQQEEPNWSTNTDYYYLSIEDIVLRDFSLPFHRRLWRYLFSFFDYALTTTGFRFFWHAWRFSIYALYPMVMLLASLLLSFIAYSWTAGSDSPFADHFGIAAFVCCFAFCYQFVLKRGHVLHLMDLWSFSTEYQYRRRPDMDDKLDRLADQIFSAASSDKYDEILAVGHSTGGALILDAASRVATRHPEYPTYADKVTVLTIGSTALKIGLHPFSSWFRDGLKNLFSTTGTHWVEIQCVTDIINFHRTNPAKIMGFYDAMQSKIHIRTIRVKEMVSRGVYERMKNNYFRIHYQFVYGNTKKYVYDFPAICFGPVTLQERLQLDHSPDAPNPYMQSLTGPGKDPL
ncbi:MAG: lipase [Hyphomicrobiales bacterium]|nr:lipase [Hyphomicrobiales bacterium]